MKYYFQHYLPAFYVNYIFNTINYIYFYCKIVKKIKQKNNIILTQREGKIQDTSLYYYMEDLLKGFSLKN